MNELPFVKAADVEGEYRIPPRVSKLLLAPKFGGVRNVSMGMNITEVGSMIPDHVHEESKRSCSSSAGMRRSLSKVRENGKSVQRPPSTLPSARSTVWRTSVMSRSGWCGCIARPCRRTAA